MHLELGEFRTTEALHEYLAMRLGLPEWYGRNWDAFWECIRDPELSQLSDHIEISGLNALAVALPRDARILRELFEELPFERSTIQIEFRP